ncbi:MAG TPA: ABC transporter substrate-binding protein [Acidimicrobiales bacterium]
MKHKKWTRGLALVAVVAIVAVGCSDKKSSDSSDKGSGGSTASGPTIRISSQAFGEQETLANVYGQYLKAHGFNVDVQRPIGTRAQIIAAMKAGKVDLELDYQASLATQLVPDSAVSPDAAATYQRLLSALKGTGLEAAASAPAQDGNALVALKSWATKNHVTSISDLKKIQDQVTIGGAAECKDRPDCLKGYENPAYYGLKFKGFKVVAYGPPLVAGLQSDAIQVAQYQTSAAEVATGQIVILTDDKHLQSPENVVPVFRSKVASAKLTAALNTLSAKITSKDLSAWNKSTDIDKDEPADVASAWLKSNGLN